MTIQCPTCHSLNIETLDYGRTTGAVVGTVAGGAGAVAAASAGARTGAIVGAAAGPFGSMAGTVIGGVLGAVAGAKVGSATGSFIDDCMLDNFHCLHCDAKFCEDDLIDPPAEENTSSGTTNDEVREIIRLNKQLKARAHSLSADREN